MLLVKNPNRIRLGMIGMSPGNGHPYSWSVIVNGRYRTEPIVAGGYPGIVEYLEVEPRETRNLYDDRSQRETVKELRERIVAWDQQRKGN